METFWPDHEPNAARNNLNVAIYTLRQALRRGAADRSTIIFHDESYLLNPELGTWLDVEEFRDRARAGRGAMLRGHLDDAVREYETAVELYQGDLLEDDIYEAWTEQPRLALHDSYVDALNFLSGYYAESGQDAACVGYCRRLLAVEPADEAIHRRLMRAYARQNQRYLAIRQYQQCVEALREHLDVAPDPVTVELYERILHDQQV
jgi:DNA-binding SARP family transcriptional activator